MHPAGAADAVRLKPAPRRQHLLPHRNQPAGVDGRGQTVAPAFKQAAEDGAAVGRGPKRLRLRQLRPMAADAAAAVGGAADAAARLRQHLHHARQNALRLTQTGAEPGAAAMAPIPIRSAANPPAVMIAAATMAKLVMAAGMAAPTANTATGAAKATATVHAAAPGGKAAGIGAAMMTGGATGAAMTGRATGAITAGGTATGGAIGAMTGTAIAATTATASASGSTMPLTATIPTVGSRLAISSIHCS